MRKKPAKITFIRKVVALNEDGTPSKKVFVEALGPGVLHQDEATYTNAHRSFKSPVFAVALLNDNAALIESLFKVVLTRKPNKRKK